MWVSYRSNSILKLSNFANYGLEVIELGSFDGSGGAEQSGVGYVAISIIFDRQSNSFLWDTDQLYYESPAVIELHGFLCGMRFLLCDIHSSS